jgi:hypothetical protein
LGSDPSIALLAGSGSTVLFVGDDARVRTLAGLGGPGARIVHTRTAERVVAVELSG